MREAICWRPQQYGPGSVSPLDSHCTRQASDVEKCTVCLVEEVWWEILVCCNDISFVSFLDQFPECSIKQL